MLDSTSRLVALAAGAIGLPTVTAIVAASTFGAQPANYGTIGVVTAATLVALSVLFVFLTSGKHVLPLSLYLLLALGQTVLFVARPGYSVLFQDGRNLFTGTPYGPSFVTAQVVAGVGFLAFSVAYGLSSRTKTDRPSGRIVPIGGDQWSRLRPWLVAVIVGGAILYSLHILSVGVGNYLALSSSGRDRELQASVGTSSGYFYSGLMIATGAILLVLVQAVATRDRRTVKVCFGGLFLFVMPSLLSGTRSQFLPIAIALFIIWMAFVPRTTAWRRSILAAPVVVVVGFVAPRIWRTSTGVEQGWLSSIGQALQPRELFGSSLGSLDTAMVDAFALQVARQDAGMLDTAGGSSYFGLIAAPVPRGVWPSKPMPTDQVLNADIFPVTAERGIGFSFSMYSEPYLNFGWIGVVGFFLVFGFLLGRLSFSLASSRTVGWLFVYALASGFTFALVRGTFTFNVQRLLIPLLPALLALWMTRPVRSMASTARARRATCDTDRIPHSQ